MSSSQLVQFRDTVITAGAAVTTVHLAIDQVGYKLKQVLPKPLN